MTEKEKMLKEMLYNANNDEDLLKERTIAKDLCFKFNQLMPSDVENQKKLLNELLGQIDDTASILASFWCDYGYNIKVGKNFFANHNTVIIDCAPVTFGDNVFIAPNCGFYTAVIIRKEQHRQSHKVHHLYHQLHHQSKNQNIHNCTTSWVVFLYYHDIGDNVSNIMKGAEKLWP